MTPFFKVALASLMLTTAPATALYAQSNSPVTQAALETTIVEENAQRVEVTFVLDTTGSMAGLIEGAKQKIWSIANTIVDVNPDADIRMSLVGYRDFGDDYVLKTYPLTDDIQGLYSKLIEFEADGGGDTPEAVNEALDASLNKVGWSQNDDTLRMVFLVGDAPPHMDYNGPKYPALVKEAHARGILVNAVQAGSMRSTRKIWQRIAQMGGGDYIPIPQSGGQVVIIETPYDDDIIILQRQLDDTVIPYGSREKRSGLFDKIRSRRAAPKSSSVENSKYYSKRAKKGEVVTGGGDLLADYAVKPETLSKVKDAELPKVLRGKSKSEREAYLQKMQLKRDAVRTKMAKLVAKRDAYIAQKKTEKTASAPKGDSFDRAVSRTIKRAMKR